MKRALAITFAIVMLCSAVSRGAVYYDDPTTVGIGARPLGMGKAFTAIVDDSNAIFLNPAGLGTQKAWNFSSMSTNFMDEYQYTMLAGVYPVAGGTYGLGYTSMRIGGIITTNEGNADFSNQALIFSYGKYIGDDVAGYIGKEHNLYGGMSLKYYSKGFSGDIQSTGAGFNIDAGLKYAPYKYISYGLLLQNIFFGSKISGDIEPEDMAFAIKAGVCFYWLENNIKFSLDKDMQIGHEGRPWPTNMGLEWKAHKNLVLRTGFNQVAGAENGGEMATNATYGIGLEYNGFKVDISYMQNFEATNIASSIVSFSLFGQGIGEIEKEKEKPVEKPAEKLPEKLPEKPIQPVTKEVLSPLTPYVSAKPLNQKIYMYPSRNMVTFKKDITFYGSVESDVISVFIDDKEIALSGDKTFSESFWLPLGKTTKTIKILDYNRTSAIITRKIARMYLPLGMDEETADKKYFEYKVIYTALYGYLGKDYPLDKRMSREMTALILAKAKDLNLNLAEVRVAKDVTYVYWAAKYIHAARIAGYMENFSDGTFRPDQLITRTELAAIMKKTTGMEVKFPAWKVMTDDATMDDMIEAAYSTGLLEDYISDYKIFLGIDTQTI